MARITRVRIIRVPIIIRMAIIRTTTTRIPTRITTRMFINITAGSSCITEGLKKMNLLFAKNDIKGKELKFFPLCLFYERVNGGKQSIACHELDFAFD
jgi:hypothetical protein